MSTPNHSPTPPDRTFELTISADASDEQILALQSLVRASGWGFRETTPIPHEDTPLQDDQLVMSSVELFGSEVYGHNAVSVLKEGCFWYSQSI
jgi:hypothetical protein